MKYQKALVTGGAGFIGSHIVHELIKLGLEVTVVDDFSVGKRNNLPKNVNIITADVNDYEKIINAFDGIDIVLHNAAKVSVRSSGNKFLEDAKSNISGTLNVLRAVINKKIKKLIYASSMAVYSEAEYLPIDENHPLSPLSPYGIGKLTGEQYCLLLSKLYGFSAIILRYFNVYGTRQTLSPYVGVINIFINSLLDDKQPLVFGDGKQIRDFVAVEDIVKANILSMSSKIDTGIFNIGSGTGKTVLEVLELICKEFGKPVHYSCISRDQLENRQSIADITRASKQLGYKPSVTLDSKLNELILYQKNLRRFK